MTIETFKQHTPTLGKKVYIAHLATVIGDVQIGEDSSVWPGAVIRGDVNSIRIGERCSIQDNSVLHVTHAGPFTDKGLALIIGNEVTIGHRATLHGCTIEDRCLIGIGAIILDGAVVRSEVMIAAGSLVPPGKICESGFLWLGNPVKKMRPLNESELEFLSYSAQHYVRLKDLYI